MFETYELADVIGLVQASLDDDSSLYSDELCTQAIRQALELVNLTCPYSAELLLSTEDGVREYTLDDFEAINIRVVQVVLAGDEDTLVPIHFYRKDGTTPAIQLHENPGSHSDHLRVTYCAPHSIDGLDGKGITSLPDWLGSALVCGAAGHAMLMRLGSRLEANNLNSTTCADILAAATRSLELFEKRLKAHAQEPAGISASATSHWPLDGWENETN